MIGISIRLFLSSMTSLLVSLTLLHGQLVPMEAGTQVELLAGDFQFTEGPAADAQGNVYFTDQPNDRIMKWSVDGNLSTFLQPAGRSNGLYFDRKGLLLACADEKNELWAIEASGRSTALVNAFEGKRLNGPNDLWVDPQNGVYFTDPLYERPWWEGRSGMEQDGQHVYYLSPDRKSLTRVIEDLVKPNGIVGSPDGKELFVADIGAGKTFVYNIEGPGSVFAGRLFCEMGSDGMTLDSEGNLYLTGKGVTIFNREGVQVGHLDVPEPWTANVCFGGTDFRTLFITASKGLYSIRMNVAGAR